VLNGVCVTLREVHDVAARSETQRAPCDVALCLPPAHAHAPVPRPRPTERFVARTWCASWRWRPPRATSAMTRHTPHAAASCGVTDVGRNARRHTHYARCVAALPPPYRCPFGGPPTRRHALLVESESGVLRSALRRACGGVGRTATGRQGCRWVVGGDSAAHAFSVTQQAIASTRRARPRPGRYNTARRGNGLLRASRRPKRPLSARCFAGLPSVVIEC
jgi:hypothetical protein